MNLKEFLDKNKVIKESALAVLMWPDKNNQAKVFSNKINEKVTNKKGGKQRITDSDEIRAKVVLLEVAERIKSFAGGHAVEPNTPKEVEFKNEVVVKKPIEKELTMAELLKQSLKK